MSGRKRYRRGLSAGTIVMLTLTALVLIGFLALLPKLTGNVDIRINASELAVALDDSISRLASSAAQGVLSRATDAPDESSQQSAVQPESLPTAAPVTRPPVFSFTLCAAGRINIDQAMQKALTSDTGYHFNRLLDGLGDEMRADLTVATLLENVIPTNKLSDSNAPVEMLGALKGAGVGALCLGHPGALDGGVDGLKQTMQAIGDAGMTAYGAFTSAEERESTVFTTVNGVKVALLSFQSEISPAGKKQTKREERELAFIQPEMLDIASTIERARQQGAQVVLVSICWGKAAAAKPSEEQRDLAQRMANAGADIILGTNPESVQTVEILTAERGDEKYHPVLCAYSMGNLTSPNRDKRANLSGILLGARVEYDSGTGLVAFDGLQYAPTYCWRGKVDGATGYGVLISNRAAPDYMDKDQLNVMQRSLAHIREVLDGSVLAER